MVGNCQGHWLYCCIIILCFHGQEIDGLIYAIDTKILYKYYFFELRKRILLLRVVCVWCAFLMLSFVHVYPFIIATMGMGTSGLACENGGINVWTSDLIFRHPFPYMHQMASFFSIHLYRSICYPFSIDLSLSHSIITFFNHSIRRSPITCQRLPILLDYCSEDFRRLNCYYTAKCGAG